jgi:hypothetical protein
MLVEIAPTEGAILLIDFRIGLQISLHPTTGIIQGLPPAA